jgi:benzoate membrane transport protein
MIISSRARGTIRSHKMVVQSRIRKRQGLIHAAEHLRTMRHDFTPAAACAALVTFVWYAFGMLPLQIALIHQLGLSPSQASSTISIVWIGGALASAALALLYRQPIAITWTTPGLIYLAAVAPQFSIAELAGANMMTGVLLVLLGVSGAAGRILLWIPLPIAMGVFAGSILAYLTRMVYATVEETGISGATILGYLLGRCIRIPSVPPMGLAVVCGALAVSVIRGGISAPIAFVAPTLEMPEASFSIVALLAISLPMVLLILGTSQAPLVSFLASQGYAVPVKATTVVIGITSIATACFGGYPASTSRDGGAIQAGPDVGPRAGRYWSTLISAILVLLLGVGASGLTSLVEFLPGSYIVTLAGLGIISSMLSAMRKAFEGPMQLGALVAFVVAATPFSVAGLPSQLWAGLAALAVSLLLERSELHGCSRHPKAS